MTEYERFHACMAYEPMDRTPFWDWGGWPETFERWKTEGFDPDSYDPASIADRRNSFGGWFFPDPPFERKVVSEDDSHVTYVNHEGILLMEKKVHAFSSMPQFIRFPVETREDFRAFWTERMRPDLTSRIGPDWREKLRELRRKPVPFIVISDRWGGFFGPLRNLTGVERLCTLFYDDPAFVEEMMDANADFIVAMMDQILGVVEVDAFGFWEDMCYNHGPLISPAMVRRYMLPRYRRVAEFLRARGVRYIGLDSDGQIESLIPIWMDAGLNFLYPFEVQCGMDVLKVRRKFGKGLRIWGGIDKRALAKGRAAIDIEIERVLPLMKEGGFVPHTDHSCPPDISYDGYRYYLERMRSVATISSGT